jgi:hypothetical protein
MRLYTLEPSSRLATNIARISREKRINVFAEYEPQSLDMPVVIGDGTPDDIAFSIVAFHLNGDKIAGIVKTKMEKRDTCIDLIPTYLKGNIRKILILMDQEDDQLDTIYERIQRGMEKLATGEVEVIDEENEERVKIYTGKYGSKDFELILVINGLDEIHTDKHSIKDHLLKAAEMLSIDIGDFENSKAAWKSINHDLQLEIFNGLKNKSEMVENVFPQQVQGCKYLTEKM